ncbi:prepilin peptidase [Methyloversatilis thermotolerans]|uniref:prepilin peptidase n=1 Tax=Methyloversatilis thermotolerans TaxID=1346290 RepID=UPI00035C8D9D|nr:A24 family peptidase [Methyloversatilis thermotolerans]
MDTLEALAASGSLLPLTGLLGLAVGSFLNVVIHRLPLMMEREWAMQCAELRGEDPPAAAPLSLLRPRSRCPHCGHGIGALENIPVLSWLWLRGRCRACGTGIGMRYPLVELLTAALSVACAQVFGPGMLLIGALLFCWALVALTFIDLDTQLLPDSITLPLLWAGLAINLHGGFTDLESAVLGAMCGYLVLWSIYWLFKLVTGKEGMGYGDFKLLAAIGAFLGWQMLPAVVLLSSVVGALVGILLIVARAHRRETPIPFGPYLAAAGLIALFFGKDLVSRYLGLFPT